MRGLRAVAMLAALAGMAPAVVAANGEGGLGPVFISPMGEPFRGPAPAEQWFRHADANGDGRLTVDEMRKDAARFFATLDLNRDGEIDPDEQAAYENAVAPEIGAVLSMSGSHETAREAEVDVTAKGSDGYPVMGNTDRHRRARRHGGDSLPLSYLDLTEPVASADRNFNRGVSLAEFDLAAQGRFHLLDKANQGYLTPAGLRSQLH